MFPINYDKKNINDYYICYDGRHRADCQSVQEVSVLQSGGAAGDRGNASTSECTHSHTCTLTGDYFASRPASPADQHCTVHQPLQD